MSEASTSFFHHFVNELRAEGRSDEEIAQVAWQPCTAESLKILGPDRDIDLRRLQLAAADIAAVPKPADFQPLDAAFYQRQKLVLVLVPGFTHETLRNYSWHEQIQRKDSPHHVVMLKPGWQGEAPQEQTFAEGDGLKLMYVRYPRSNADSQHIVGPMFEMLHRSATLRRWVELENRKIVFVGYSYGAPLSLELLAGMNSGALADGYLLQNTLGFLSLCGAIGGSYLADDVLKPDAKLIQIQKVIDFCRRHPLVGKLAGLGTQQLLADMEDGVRSLGHEVRQKKILDYAEKLPAHLKYFSISAVLPLEGYRRRWRQFNLDDYTMYKQAQVTDPITVYNDGQMALPDNLVPAAPQIPPENLVQLGAVRTHHWGVSYKTFNLGNNRFPRPAFYRAVLRTMLEAL